MPVAWLVSFPVSGGAAGSPHSKTAELAAALGLNSAMVQTVMTDLPAVQLYFD
ncbi:hypothetical protein P7K49_020592 [Saguinus oedipus]|uniref:Uncharacterized protein n=1 Tax=Saguinus oedipus TaxID=9490 RepID=A0ABQ9V1F0_SAGOE|nr:hypothetical protein P7K49_020592 [Saguinus oedipus]